MGEAYISKARRSNRLAGHFESFSHLASGHEGRPITRVQLEADLLGFDRECLDYAAVRALHAGVFNEHFVASLPYILEEQCRLGAALLRHATWLAMEKRRPASYYTLGDGAGVTARALSEASHGEIATLVCSPNVENRQAFELGRPQGASFFLGPFFEVCPEVLAGLELPGCDGGFDVIIEDTTFQMYGPERVEPIEIALRNLREDGVFLFLEKFSHEDPEEFFRGEAMKDGEFKARFFAPEQIAHKRASIVDTMDRNLVTLSAMTDALRHFFDHAVVIWNSGNFHTIAASNHRPALDHLLGALVPPALPARYLHHELPLVLLGMGEGAAAFRHPEPRNAASAP